MWQDFLIFQKSNLCHSKKAVQAQKFWKQVTWHFLIYTFFNILAHGSPHYKGEPWDPRDPGDDSWGRHRDHSRDDSHTCHKDGDPRDDCHYHTRAQFHLWRWARDWHNVRRRFLCTCWPGVQAQQCVCREAHTRARRQARTWARNTVRTFFSMVLSFSLFEKCHISFAIELS